MKKITRSLVYIFSIPVIFYSCKNNHQDTIIANSGICDTTDTKFSTVIYPSIVTNCNSSSGCHGGSNLGSISLESYQAVHDNYDNILSRINSGNMPKGSGKLDNCTILKFQTWVNRGAQNN